MALPRASPVPRYHPILPVSTGDHHASSCSPRYPGQQVRLSVSNGRDSPDVSPRNACSDAVASPQRRPPEGDVDRARAPDPGPHSRADVTGRSHHGRRFRRHGSATDGSSRSSGRGLGSRSLSRGRCRGTRRCSCWPGAVVTVATAWSPPAFCIAGVPIPWSGSAMTQPACKGPPPTNSDRCVPLVYRSTRPRNRAGKVPACSPTPT